MCKQGTSLRYIPVWLELFPFLKCSIMTTFYTAILYECLATPQHKHCIELSVSDPEHPFMGDPNVMWPNSTNMKLNIGDVLKGIPSHPPIGSIFNR